MTPSDRIYNQATEYGLMLICGTCAGSGEGMYDRSICTACGGRGEVRSTEDECEEVDLGGEG